MGAKKLTPSTSLGTLVIASVFIDLIWPIFLLLGYEEVRIAPGITLVTPLDFVNYPYSHSLLAVVIWGALLGATILAVKSSRRAALCLALLVISHWLLDVLVHRPDLPIAPDSGKFIGLSLWNSYSLTFALEFGLFFLGLFIYTRTTHSRNRLGKTLLWVLVLLLLVIYLSSVFGPPPPDARTVAIAALGQWLFVLLFYWLDHHRRAYVV